MSEARELQVPGGLGGNIRVPEEQDAQVGGEPPQLPRHQVACADVIQQTDRARFRLRGHRED